MALVHFMIFDKTHFSALYGFWVLFDAAQVKIDSLIHLFLI